MQKKRRNKVTSELWKQKSTLSRTLANPHNPKKFWKAVKYLTKNQHTFQYLIDQENCYEANGSVGKADMLNFTLCNILTQGFPMDKVLHNISLPNDSINCRSVL